MTAAEFVKCEFVQTFNHLLMDKTFKGKDEYNF